MPQSPMRMIWFGAFDVASLGQIVDLRCRDLWRFTEVELLQRLHARQASVLDPACDGVAFAFLQLGGKQGFEIAQIRLPLLGGHIGQRSTLFRYRWQA